MPVLRLSSGETVPRSLYSRSLFDFLDVNLNEYRRRGSGGERSKAVSFPFVSSSTSKPSFQPRRVVHSHGRISRVSVDFSGGGRCIFDILSGGSQDGGKGRADIVDRDCLQGINWNRLRCRVMPFIVICSIPTTPVCLAASLDAIHCRLLSNLRAEYADRSFNGPPPGSVSSRNGAWLFLPFNSPPVPPSLVPRKRSDNRGRFLAIFSFIFRGNPANPFSFVFLFSSSLSHFFFSFRTSIKSFVLTEGSLRWARFDDPR